MPMRTLRVHKAIPRNTPSKFGCLIKYIPQVKRRVTISNTEHDVAIDEGIFKDLSMSIVLSRLPSFCVGISSASKEEYIIKYLLALRSK